MDRNACLRSYAGSMTTEDDLVDAFWHRATQHLRMNPAPGYFGASALEALTPPAWAFGATPDHADDLLGLVLDGTKTATSSSAWDLEAEGEDVPQVGAMSIVVDGTGRPRAVLVTTAVEVVPFDRVDADHARAEGEGDRSLDHWREVHRRFFTDHAVHNRGFSPEMPVVTERFEVLYQE